MCMSGQPSRPAGLLNKPSRMSLCGVADGGTVIWDVSSQHRLTRSLDWVAKGDSLERSAVTFMHTSIGPIL